MKRRDFLVGTALLAGTLARGRAADIPAPSPAGLDRITTYFDNEVGSGRLPGAVILVQQHGKPVYLKNFGVRDTRTSLAMTPDTIFAIHSMTKPITCLGAMMLIDQGKLALTDPVSKYIPLFAGTKVGLEISKTDGKDLIDLVTPVRPVNIEDLLRHTSGISYDYIGAPWVMKVYDAADIFDGPFNNRQFADRIARLPLTRQPGSLWRYGHSTDVLGAIIEIISGQTLYGFLKQRIFDPLGMNSTKFVLTTPEERARMARPLPNDPILLAGERDRLAHPEWESGGGGLLSTITDYQRFSQMLLNGGEFEGKRYLSPAAFKAMTTDHVGPGSGVGRDYFYFPGDGFGYGYGIGVRTDPGNAKPPPPGSIGELKWDSGSGTYFGIDPKLDMVYLMMQQTQNERSRITPAFKALVYDCYPQELRRP
ncbi:beta-lactamase family protein [Bradyrhizobium diazoefficiens]|nr:serine hydrolase domain-containing protein [Bradyrhizobium diazoefficiens]MBR0847148.1 beta-lactamase family protein [Bradyrhizobium diazoefficiens]